MKNLLTDFITLGIILFSFFATSAMAENIAICEVKEKFQIESDKEGYFFCCTFNQDSLNKYTYWHQVDHQEYHAKTQSGVCVNLPAARKPETREPTCLPNTPVAGYGVPLAYVCKTHSTPRYQ